MLKYNYINNHYNNNCYFFLSYVIKLKGHDTQSISGDNFKLRSSFSREYSSCISNLKMIALDFAGHNIDFNSHSQFIASSGEEKILVKCTKDNKLLYMQNK